MQDPFEEKKWVPVDEILRFLYGHKHHLFEYFQTKWSPTGQRLTYKKVPSLLYNSIVMFAYNYQKEIWCISDDRRAFSLCNQWANVVMKNSTGASEDSFLSRHGFFDIVKLLQTKKIDITGIELIRTSDPTLYGPPSEREPSPPENLNSSPSHSNRRLKPFDAIVSAKDHQAGGYADPGTQRRVSFNISVTPTASGNSVLNHDRHELSEGSNDHISEQTDRRIDRHDKTKVDHTSSFLRRSTLQDTSVRRGRHAIGAQVRHKQQIGQVSVSAKIDRSLDEIVRNSYESKSCWDMLFAAGFDPYCAVTFAPFEKNGPNPKTLITKHSDPVYNVKRACQWQKQDSNIMKFRMKTSQLQSCGLRFCIYDEEMGFGMLDSRLGGVMVRVGDHITEVGQYKHRIELVLKRRRHFCGILHINLSALRSRELSKDECVLKVEVDTASALKKDRGEEAGTDGTTALVYVIGFIVYLVVVGYVFKILEADEVGAKIQSWSDGFWFSFITATTVGYGDMYPISDAGLYVNCFVMLMDVIFLGFVMSLAFDFVVSKAERRSRIYSETGGLDLFSDLSFYEFLYLANTSKKWKTQQKRDLKEFQETLHSYDIAGRRVFVKGDFGKIHMEDFDVTAVVEGKHGVIVDELTKETDLCIFGSKTKKYRERAAKFDKKDNVEVWDSVDFRYWQKNYREETWINGVIDVLSEYNQMIIFSGITFGFVIIGCFVWIFVEEMDLDAAVHFCFVSMSTVGYGDIAPTHAEGKWFCAFYILIGVGVLARLGSLLTDSIVEKQSDKITQKIADEMLMHPSQLQEMDIDGRGRVDRYEFMRGLLMAMGKARLADFVGIESRFREIDEDGSGIINKEDFDLMLEKRQLTKLHESFQVKVTPSGADGTSTEFAE